MALHFERMGVGPPLLMVHGLGGSIRSWDTIAPTLSLSRELILIDMPGHGESPPVPGRQTMSAFADALTDFIDRERLGAVDLVGSSVGARLVLELSRRGVGRHCVALDPGGFWRGWETRFFQTTILASIRLVRGLQPVMPFLSRHSGTRTLLLAQLSDRPWALAPEIVLTEMRTFAATRVFDEVVHELASGPLQAGTAFTPGRVTIGWGRQDRLLLPRQAHRAQAAFPNAKLHLFDKCGHFPHWDQPEETARIIVQTTD
ncbi:alpha/beta fold hydrolase [Caulobacter sp. DWR2-3-1b2]|uniref:alpha/beta fold hydrolase n=1 Tax=unclassified Caulobacter TaxID=2648921 RepID=UPI003CF63899